jgi:hypothetical protein
MRRQGASLTLLTATAAVLLSMSASASTTNLVSDPGFESAGGGNTYYSGQSIDGGSWFVGGGASTVYIDFQDPYVYDGNNSANLTAFSPYTTSSLYQNLTTVVGQTYWVNFWANSDSPNIFSLTENANAVSGIPGSIVDNGFPDQVDPNGNSALFVDYAGAFVATSTTTDLSLTTIANPTLAEYQAGDGSVVIDDVSVTATPEPSSIVLMLTGLLGLGLLVGRKRLRLPASGAAFALFIVAGIAALTKPAFASGTQPPALTPGNVVVMRTVYSGTAGTVVVGENLPPNCVPSVPNSVTCGNAALDGTFPYVFNNDGTADGSFAVTSPIFLDELTPAGALVNSIEVPNSLMNGITGSSDQMVSSFSSKSEGALHLSTDTNYLTLMEYVAPANALDVSNSNTPGVIDPTNPDPGPYYRAVATVNAEGQFTFTQTNANSGDNPRAAIYVNTGGHNFFYVAGNAGNGANPEPQGVVLGAGAQIIQALNEPESSQNPGQPTPLASFNPTQLGDAADKAAKDNNYRGMTLYNNVLYYAKGSGSNGVNTVFFVDTTGTACPTTGIGLPVPNAPLPTTSIASTYSTSSTKDGLTKKNPGLTANNMCILAGFPTLIAKSTSGVSYPFGLWFANATTLYVADEGNGSNTYDATTNTYTDASAQIGTAIGGLQKWIFNSGTQTWNLAYTLQTGLNLGTPYSAAGLLAGDNNGLDGTGLPWAPATGGLRQLIGTIGGNRILGQTVTIWATSATVSGNGDQGSDPNKLYRITDKLANTSATVAAEETFTDVYDASFGEVLRGVTFTPGTPLASASY